MGRKYLRLLAEKKKGYWLATCLELNIMVVGDTPKAAFQNLKEAIEGYLDAVFDTEDRLSIPALLNRPAPLSKRLRFIFGGHFDRMFAWLRTEFFDPMSFKHHGNNCHAHA